MELPVTIADWAATEARFKKHFRPVPADLDEETLTRFDEYVAAPREDREGMTPFIFALGEDRKLSRLLVAEEIVDLAEDRLNLWTQIKQLAGIEVSASTREALVGELQESFDRQADELKAQHESRLAELKAKYPPLIARRLAEGLIRAGEDGRESIGDLLGRVQSMDLEPIVVAPGGNGEAIAQAVGTVGTVEAAASVGTVATVEEAPAAEDEEGITLEPYIDSERCTTCDECTNLNRKLFAYDDRKQAYVKDATAGTFRQIVTAAERCPVGIIHPGTPLNPKEKDLDKWVKRAERFQ
jgi:pyruvate-ferredoxin/flavodoxin oxidoreductase